jgi:Ca2+-binding EF-hand superfamily protein
VQFTLQARRLQQRLDLSLKDTAHASFRRTATSIETVFEDVLYHQIVSGTPCTQGIVSTYFQLFLAKVAKALGLTGEQLIGGLCDDSPQSGRAHKGGSGDEDGKMLRYEDDDTRGMAFQLVTGITGRRPQDSCQHCGNKYLSDAKFCRNCGRERGADPSQQFTMSSKPKAKNGANAVDEVVTLAKKHELLVKDVRTYLDEFESYDKDGTHTLSLKEFLKALKKRLGLPHDAELPRQMVNQNWLQADLDNDASIDFEEFLLWSINVGDNLAESNHQEKHWKKLAETYGVELHEVDRLKKVFDRFDTDRSGLIDETEFASCIFALMKVKNPSDIPSKMLRRFWREATSNSGTSEPKIKVSGLQAEKPSEEEIKNAFSQFGPVIGVDLRCDDKNVFRGFCYVTFESLETAKRAVDGCRDVKIQAEPLECQLAGIQAANPTISCDQFMAWYFRCFRSSDHN